MEVAKMDRMQILLTAHLLPWMMPSPKAATEPMLRPTTSLKAASS